MSFRWINNFSDLFSTSIHRRALFRLSQPTGNPSVIAKSTHTVNKIAELGKISPSHSAYTHDQFMIIFRY